MRTGILRGDGIGFPIFQRADLLGGKLTTQLRLVLQAIGFMVYGFGLLRVEGECRFHF